MAPMICRASGETIPPDAAYVTDADGNHYLPEHYPDAQTGKTEYEEQNPPEPEPEPAPKKASK